MSLSRLLTLMAGKDKKLYTAATLSCIVATLVFLTSATGRVIAAPVMDGKTLVMERSRGNCLACHVIAGGVLPGNIGPPLMSMKARFPDDEVLREQIWDATVRNPDSRMPPFGRHGILSRAEIDLIVKYLYTL